MLPGMDYRQPIRQLQATPHKELPAIVAATGLGLQTLRQLKYGRGGQQTNPRIDTVEKLQSYFEGR